MNITIKVQNKKIKPLSEEIKQSIKQAKYKKHIKLHLPSTIKNLAHQRERPEFKKSSSLLEMFRGS